MYYTGRRRKKKEERWQQRQKQQQQHPRKEGAMYSERHTDATMADTQEGIQTKRKTTSKKGRKSTHRLEGPCAFEESASDMTCVWVTTRLPLPAAPAFLHMYFI